LIHPFGKELEAAQHEYLQSTRKLNHLDSWTRDDFQLAAWKTVGMIDRLHVSHRICLSSNISNEAKFEIHKRDLPPAPKRKEFETAQLEHLQRKWDRPLKLTNL